MDIISVPQRAKGDLLKTYAVSTNYLTRKLCFVQKFQALVITLRCVSPTTKLSLGLLVDALGTEKSLEHRASAITQRTNPG